MHQFSPYTISHLQLPEAVALPVVTQNRYVVLWWQKVPLGHVWIEKEAPYSEAAFRAEVLNAIQPALQFYFSKDAAVNDWQTSFLAGDAKPLLRLLQANEALQVLWQAQDKLFLNPHNTDERLSVVICTRNRTQALQQCITALLRSSDKNFELVIVDNAPDDDSTRDLVQQFPDVRYVQEPRKGLDIARNTGAQAASCAIVAYTDDDVTVDVDWIKNLKACFAMSGAACITGLVIPLELQTESQYRFEKFWGFNKGYKPLVFDAAYFEKHKASGVPVWDIGAGANMAFRKSLFQQIGYFDERLDVGAAGCSGDSELWYRALAEGFQCHYFPHLFVYHQHRTTKKELDNQIFHYMRGQVASLLVQYEKYGHRGNLKRLYRELPNWYKTRLRNKLRGRSNSQFETLFTEIRGCISGWRFYQKHKK